MRGALPGADRRKTSSNYIKKVIKHNKYLLKCIKTWYNDWVMDSNDISEIYNAIDVRYKKIYRLGGFCKDEKYIICII